MGGDRVEQQEMDEMGDGIDGVIHYVGNFLCFCDDSFCWVNCRIAMVDENSYWVKWAYDRPPRELGADI